MFPSFFRRTAASSAVFSMMSALASVECGLNPMARGMIEIAELGHPIQDLPSGFRDGLFFELAGLHQGPEIYACIFTRSK